MPSNFLVFVVSRKERKVSLVRVWSRKGEERVRVRQEKERVWGRG